MPSNPKPDATAQAPSDVFDMERPPSASTAPNGNGKPSETAQSAKPAISIVLKAAKPVHFGLVIAIATIVWIGWPYIFPNDSTTAQPASRLMLPATAESMPRKTSPAPLPDSTAPRRLEAAPVPPETSAPSPSELPPFARPLPPPPAPPAQPIPLKRARETTRTARTTIKRPHTNAGVVGAATARFSLNTVYVGQAWIQDDEHTYVVQAGDTVKGVEILSIDARERRVVTSQGVIR